MTKRKLYFTVAALTLILLSGTISAAVAPRFEVSYSAAAHSGPVTGRLVLILATKEKPEPRMTVSPSGPAIFAVDIDHLQPGQAAVVDSTSLGYPKRNMSELPPGDYYAQAVINVYTEMHRADGHNVWVHMNDGTIEFFTAAAGNLYSDVQRVHLGEGGKFKLEIDHVIPQPPQRADTSWVKNLRMESKLLTKFWGHPVYIHATVLLPKGYDEHPGVYYPVIFPLGHGVPFSFNTDSESAKGQKGPNPDTGLASGYESYLSWNSDNFPRVIAVTLQQQTPYFPDSYSVNSANNGPYGDMFVQELIPFLEDHLRIIRKPYARILEGASTSGWQTLALQLQHPDVFGGAWVLQPDPIDFQRYQLVDIYQDENAFSIPVGPLTSTERPMRRSVEGQVVWTVRELSLFEEVLGTRGRSSFQFEAWEAVYGPTDAQGYPMPLWDKLTGKIDRNVANYMRDHGYDLREYAQRNWSTLGPKIISKLHFFCGDMDNFYLNLAVYHFQDFLKTTKDPHYEAEFTYGRPMKGHAWHDWTWPQMVRDMAKYVQKNAPAGESTAAWNY